MDLFWGETALAGNPYPEGGDFAEADVPLLGELDSIGDEVCDDVRHTRRTLPRGQQLHRRIPEPHRSLPHGTLPPTSTANCSVQSWFQRLIG